MTDNHDRYDIEADRLEDSGFPMLAELLRQLRPDVFPKSELAKMIADVPSNYIADNITTESPMVGIPGSPSWESITAVADPMTTCARCHGPLSGASIFCQRCMADWARDE